MSKLPNLAALAAPISFTAAAALCVGVAVIGAITVENRSVADIETALTADGNAWAEVTANGLQVFLDGTAPSEAARFRAETTATAIVDAQRVINRLGVETAEATLAPRFSLDMLRNGDGVQLIGLIPAPQGDEAFSIAETIADIAGSADVVNMIETTTLPMPDGWQAALDYGLRALETLPRSKVTVLVDRVEVEAVGESREQRAEFIAALRAAQPQGIEVVLDISAPRPVISPYALRFTLDATGGRFETCTADTSDARDRIVAAGLAAGASGIVPCTIGLGVPSPSWSRAVEQTLQALADLGAGSVTFSNADITLVAAEGTPQDQFDTVVGELDVELPDVFSLSAVLERPSNAEGSGPARFSALLDPENGLRLRGRLPEGEIGASVQTFAAARFGPDRVDSATRAVTDLPAGWTVRVLAGLNLLSQINEGQLVVEPEILRITGAVGDADLIPALTQSLSDDLGPGANFQLDLRYDDRFDPVASLPDAEQCVGQIQAIQAAAKITFDPGSTEINQSAGEVLDQIAEVLPDCLHVRMEIGGHTDSQGREEMNLNLSQQRANAVLNGLLARGVLVSNLTAQGYGESQPIADNETEEGREENRRIEFRLLVNPEPEPAEETAASGAQAGIAATSDGIPVQGQIADWPFEARPLPRPEPPENN